MDGAGLTMCPVSAACVIQAGRKTSGQTSKSFCLGRLQPDFLALSQELKRIAAIDSCPPSDVHSHQLSIAFTRKETRCAPLTEALSHYTDSGWAIMFFHGWWESETSWMM